VGKSVNFIYTGAIATIATLDLESLVKFYVQLLGHTPQIYLAKVYAEFGLVGCRLGIFQTQDEQEFASGGKGSWSLCLQVDDLEKVIAHFTALGYPPPGKILTTSHGKEIYAYDPEGNRLILHQPL